MRRYERPAMRELPIQGAFALGAVSDQARPTPRPAHWPSWIRSILERVRRTTR